MGLTQIPREDHLLIKKTYQETCWLRARTFESKSAEASFADPSAFKALAELYDMAIESMCARYPQYFAANGDKVHNNILNCDLPREAKHCNDEKHMLQVLACNLEEDPFVLVKNGVGAYKDDYVLRAGVSMFPSGFHPGKKANKPMTAIHTPVPGYKPNLQSPMNKFFNQVKVIQFMKRNNWSIQAHQKGFAATENHSRPNDKVEPLNPETLDFNKIFLRVERQVVTRLPRTGAIAFSIRTYFAPISKLRLEEGTPQRLCAVIDALPEGMATYKKRAAWVKQSRRI